MKLKLFLISTIVLLALVAYQKYSEYSALKSIDSYDSCIAATGSRIQESYPATCITRLSSRFAQSDPAQEGLQDADHAQLTSQDRAIPNTWLMYTNSEYKFSFRYPPEFKLFSAEKITRDYLSVKFRANDYGKTTEDGFKIMGSFEVDLKKTDLPLDTFIATEFGLEKLNYSKQLLGKYSNNQNDPIYYLNEIGEKVVGQNKVIYYQDAGAAAGDWYYFTKPNRGTTVARLNWTYPDYFNEEYIDPILSTFEFTN